MKRILAAICVLMLLVAGCGKGNSTPEVASEKDILKAISGEYLRTDDVKDFKKTKSVVDSFSGLRTMRIEDGEVIIGDGHQGVKAGKITSAVQNENGNYAIEAFENEENNIKGEFSPETNIFSGNLKTTFPRKYDNVIEYTKFGTYDDVSFFLGSIIFAGNENITEEDGKYTAQVNGKKVYLAVSPDTAEPLIADGCLGIIFVTEEGKNERIGASYKFEGNKLVLCDEDGVIIARI